MKFNPIYDYGNSDLSNKENLIYWQFGEFIKTLITLSSNANRQIEIIGAGAVADEMAEDLHTYFTLHCKQFFDNKLLNETEINLLNQLSDFLESSGDKYPNFWDDKTLATNKDWEKVRTKAKKILTLLKMENLDIEFERTEKYDMTNESKKLLIQTTKIRLIYKNSY
jgi:hypothetical protein